MKRRFDEKRIDLINAILGLGEIARFRGYPAVQTGSYATALDVASNLPENRVLPKVAVDEDGDILMVWGEPRASFAMTIQGKTIHMVLNPGSSSTHLDPIIYHETRSLSELIRLSLTAAHKVREANAAIAELTRLREALALVLEAVDRARLVTKSGCGVGGQTIEANLKASAYNGVDAWPIECARAIYEERE